MRRLLLGLVGVGTTACTAILGSFEVSDSVVAPVDGATIDGATPTGDASVDAPVVCESGTACGSTCVPDLKTAEKHCGACGHDCGGGSCIDGSCQIANLYEDQSRTVGTFSVAPTEIFFGVDDKLLACANTGCKGLPPRQVSQTQYGFSVAASRITDTVHFESAPVQNTERPAMYGCPLAGCPGVISFWQQDGLNGFGGPPIVAGMRVYANSGGNGLVTTTCAAGDCAKPGHLLGLKSTHGVAFDDNNVYFIDATTRGGAISKCGNLDASPCVPTVVVSGDASAIEDLVLFGNRLWWLLKGRDGYNEGKIVSCDLATNCTVGSPAAIVNGLNSPTQLAVDASGFYWLNGAGVIEKCLPGNCVGGPKPYISGPLADVHNFVLTDTAFYWADTHAFHKLAK